MEKILRLAALAILLSLGGCGLIQVDDLKPGNHSEMNVPKSGESPDRDNG